MDAKANSLPAVPSRQLMSIGEASARFGVHANTLRLACNQEKLRCYRVGRTGHRRLAEADVLDWLGVEPSDECSIATQKVVIYARVSSNAQSKGFSKGSDDNDLARQVERLNKVAKKEYGESPLVYSDTGSGLSFTRKSFCRLLDDILRGKLDGSTLLVTFKDRLARFGSEIVERICKAHDIQVEYIETEVTENEQKELADDLLSIITHFSARAYGSRSAKRTREELSAETVSYASDLLNSGLTLEHVLTILEEKGHRTLKGKKVTRWILRKYLTNELVAKTVQVEKTSNSFQGFHRECMKRIPIQLNPRTQKADISCRLLKQDMLRAYAKYCRKNKLIRVPDKQVGTIMRKELGYQVMMNRQGLTTYVGVALKK